MLEISEVTYAAIITISLPGVEEHAVANVKLAPQDAIKTTSGETKLLRDCTLADLQAFAETLESEIWEQYQALKLGELAADESAHVKITILNETGKPLAATPQEWLAQAVIIGAIEERVEVSAPLEGDEPREAERATEAAPDAGDSPPAAVTEDTGVETAAQEEAPPAVQTEGETVKAPEEAEASQAEAAAEVPVAEAPADVEKETETEPAPVPPAPEPTTPPARELRIAGLRRPVGHPTQAAVDILINELAFRDSQAHALSSLDREVAGMLVGPRPEKQPDGRYVVHVTDVIIAKHTRMQGASVTYTPESWRYIHDKLGERYPNEEAVIVGWYHTHPGFGIFLSGMDLFIHQNFFTQIWHIALVLDPLARKSGFFCWNRGKSKVERYEFPWPTWAQGSW